MRFLRTPIRIIRRDRRAFLVLNGVAFGFFLVGFVLGLIFSWSGRSWSTSRRPVRGHGDRRSSRVSGPAAEHGQRCPPGTGRLQHELRTARRIGPTVEQALADPTRWPFPVDMLELAVHRAFAHLDRASEPLP